jgi:hemerythrin-like metal-binding protein
MMENRLLSIRSSGVLAYLYLAGGLLALLAMGATASRAVGLLMIAAGIFEWARRIRGKGAALAPSTSPSQPGGPPPEPSLMLIHWRDSYECGHPVIDMQHRELFNIGNDLINAVLDGKPEVGIEYLLHELIEHVKDHFASEEEVLVRTRYPQIEEHRELHRSLLGRASDLEYRCREGLLPMSDLVGFIAYDVIAAHIIQEDLKFALRSR